MNKVLGRNFSKKHCKDKECEEACKVNKEEESLENFDDVENFKSALYDAMKKVVKRFAHKGATLKDLEVDENNLAAQKLYSGVGFIQTGRRRGYYKHKNGSTDALCLTKKI